MSKKIFLVIICLVGFCELGSGQDKTPKPIMLGVLNDKAKVLPMPKPAPRPHIVGNSNVHVKIDLQKGEVVEAKAISGHPLVWMAIENAARQAKFEPILTEFDPIYGSGILVYKLEDFNGKTIENKSAKPLLPIISVGVVNKKAISLPKPPIPSGGTIRQDSIVGVSIIIDMDGKVILAKAILGHPLLYQACENAAWQTKFSPTLINGPRILVKALLVYKFKPDGTIDTEIEQNDKDVVGKPINLVKPLSPFCNCRFGSNPVVIVKTQIDEQGNVIKATAMSGHSILRQASEKAALESKFLPTNIKASRLIVYSFTEVDKWSVKSSNIEVKIEQVWK